MESHANNPNTAVKISTLMQVIHFSSLMMLKILMQLTEGQSLGWS